MTVGSVVVVVAPLQMGYTGLFAVSALLCLAGLLRARTIPDPEIRRGLIGLLTIVAVWGLLAATRLLITNAVVQKGLYTVGLVVGFASVLAWLYFTSAYSGRAYHRDQRFRRGAVVIYVVVALAKLTNPFHDSYFTAQQVATPFPHLAIQQAPVHWLVVGLAYSGAAVGFLLLYDTFARSRYETSRLVGLAAVAVCPVAADVVALTNPAVPEVNFEAVGVGVFAVGVLFFVEDDFLRARVTARRALLRDHPDPTLVLDDGGRLLDYNDEAAALYDGLRPRADIESVAPGFSAALSEDGMVTFGDRSFAVRTKLVPVRAGRSVTTVVLREVTETERQRLEIERQNRQLEGIADAVAHNLRNASNVLLGHVRRASRVDHRAGGVPDRETAPDGGPAAESLAAAERTAERVAAVAEDLRLVADLGRTVTVTDEVPLPEAVDEARRQSGVDDVAVGCADTTVEANRSRLAVLLSTVFRFHAARGATTVTVEPLAPGEEAGFAVVGDGDPVPSTEVPELLRFGAESSVEMAGLGLPVAGALAAAHGWTMAVEDHGGRVVVRTDGGE